MNGEVVFNLLLRSSLQWTVSQLVNVGMVNFTRALREMDAFLFLFFVSNWVDPWFVVALLAPTSLLEKCIPIGTVQLVQYLTSYSMVFALHYHLWKALAMIIDLGLLQHTCKWWLQKKRSGDPFLGESITDRRSRCTHVFDSLPLEFLIKLKPMKQTVCGLSTFLPV